MQTAPTLPYDRAVSRVVQIRDVPDDVHEELRAAAEARGQSLTRYALAALEDAVRRQRSVAHNAEVIRRAEAEIGADVSREAILEALRDVRGEWGSSTPAWWSTCWWADSTRPRWARRRPAFPTCSTAR